MKNTNSTYQVFTVHDSRLEPDKSVVYVGLTHRPDMQQCVTAVFREHLPELKEEMRRNNVRADVQLRGPRTDKTTALQLKSNLIAQYQASGSEIQHIGRSMGAPFTITPYVDEAMS